MLSRRLFVVYWLILLAFFGNWLLSGPQAQMDPFMLTPEVVRPNTFYSDSDFYYLEKDGRRTPLVLYPKSLVVRFSSEAYQETDRSAFFEKMGWKRPGVSIERLEAILGAGEVKHSLKKPIEVFIVSFGSPQEISPLLNKAMDDKMILDAAPVFRKDGDLVFPAGLWVKTKYFDSKEPENLFKGLREEGYQRLEMSQDVLPPRLYYYQKTPGLKKVTNVLKLSRLAAQSVWASWSVPDFVSVHTLIRISVDFSKPSGVMGETFRVSYRILYESNKITVDTDDLQKIDASRLRPSQVATGLFRIDPLSLDSIPGEILLKMSFRVYQPGDFSLPGLKVSYVFKGGSSDFPSEVVATSDIFFRVAGFVPKDGSGKPTVSDIFGWKKEKGLSVVIPEKPAAKTYPKTDLRFWTKELLLKYPLFGRHLRQFSFVFWFLALLISIRPAVRLTRVKMRIYREDPYRVFVKMVRTDRALFKDSPLDHEHSDSILRAGRAVVRGAVGLPEGKTDREILESSALSIRPLVEKMLLLLNPDSYKRGFLDQEEVAVIKNGLITFNRALYWRRKRESLYRLGSKVKFWRDL